MIWSRYNTLFHSDRFGYFLYNAFSNTLFEIDEAHYDALKMFRDFGNGSENFNSDFLSLLQEHKVLIADKDENRLLLTRHYQHYAQYFDTSRLGLTICPTLQCNFRCPYCFEQNQQNLTIMTHETIKRLINFIESYKDIRHLSLAWYGGEPLLAFDVIRDITERIKSLSPDFEGAILVTNGYLLDKSKCDLLNELKIHSIQITLDGPEEIHNKRRFLAGGRPTFQRILANLDYLMNSKYEGSCHIRVDIDKHNIEVFPELHALLTERYKGKKLTVYAARVQTNLGHSYDHSCCFKVQEWADFTFNMHRRYGLIPTDNFYPSGNIDSSCVASTHNKFVIGPEGELYKCWSDVGKPAMVIGNIYEDEPVTNSALRAQYTIGIDPYCDPDCLACSVLPICGGGCANMRLRAKQFGEEGCEFCSPYKENLTNYLEEYIDTFLSKEICIALLSSIREIPANNGYRDISPKRKWLEESRTRRSTPLDGLDKCGI